MKKSVLIALSLLMTAYLGSGGVTSAVAVSTRPHAQQDVLPWMNTSLPAARRAELLIAAMTLDQKLEHIFNKPVYNPDLDAASGGNPTDRKGCDFTIVGRHIEGIPALKIPDFRMANGGTGIRGGDCTPEPTATALPAQVSSAATFNRSLNFRWGQLLDRELHAWAHQVLWGPVINLIRTPYGGRNQEFFSEDPYLTGVLGSDLIRGIQARGVSQATVKHFVANDSEYQFERWTSANRVPPRALHELYLLPFEMAVKTAHPASIMCAYPHVNFTYNCSSSPLLRKTLRQDWGYRGYVYSDRRAMQATVASIKAGVAVEVDEAPDWYAPARVKAALAAGLITVRNIDDLLRNRYIKMFQFGDFDHPATHFTFNQVDLSPAGADAKFSKQAAAESLVLLRNSRGLLPLDAKAVKSVALIGPDWFAGEATLPPRSGNRADNIGVVAPYKVSPRQGLENTLAHLGASNVQVTYNDGDVIADAVDLAAKSDVTVLMVGDVARETWDKNADWREENPGGNTKGAGKEIPDLDLPSVNGTNQQQLIPRILAANPNTVVVLKTEGQVNMPWINQVHTMVEAWYPGQEDGNVVADMLFGVTNPSGKLPLTIGRTPREAAYRTQTQYPGHEEQTGTPGGIGRDPIPGAPQRVVRYTENLRMGYRWYEATGTKPLFPFGHGLSYTTFRYSNLRLAKLGSRGRAGLRVSYTITNTGTRAGKEASQVYLRLPARADEPSKRLVQFSKVALAPGQSKRVTVGIGALAANHPFSYWSPKFPGNLRRWAEGSWKTARGVYTVRVGGSSASTPLARSIRLNLRPASRTRSLIRDVHVRPRHPGPRVRAHVTFTVRSGGAPAAGRVVVRERGRVLGRDTLSVTGNASVQIRRLGVGSHRIALVYPGTTRARAVTEHITIRVRR
jgi:beta-glucosidase